MDGPGFHEAARSLWPEIDLVLVYVTGTRDVELVALKARCFTKPVDADFYVYVRGVVERWRQAP